MKRNHASISKSATRYPNKRQKQGSEVLARGAPSKAAVAAPNLIPLLAGKGGKQTASTGDSRQSKSDGAKTQLKADSGDPAMQIDSGPQGAETDADRVIGSLEGSLASLYKNNKQLFDKLTSQDFQTRDVNTMCTQRLVGNHCKHMHQAFVASRESPHWQQIEQRAESFEPDWFRGKRVLEVGSHDGALALVLAAKYEPTLVIGADIDHRLTSKAMKTMHECINNEQTAKIISEQLASRASAAPERKPSPSPSLDTKLEDLLSRVSLLPKSMQLSISGMALRSAHEAKGQDFLSTRLLKKELYSKVSFRSENYVASILPSQDVLLSNEKFDTILCLGVTKYISLNFGDQGISALFLKAFHQLAPGGTFLLGPQPWSSFKSEKGRSPQFREMCDSVIQLKPGLYLRYLKQIGFVHEKTLQADEQAKTGIVYVLKKP